MIGTDYFKLSDFSQLYEGNQIETFKYIIHHNVFDVGNNGFNVVI